MRLKLRAFKNWLYDEVGHPRITVIYAQNLIVRALTVSFEIGVLCHLGQEKLFLNLPWQALVKVVDQIWAPLALGRFTHYFRISSYFIDGQ